VRLLSTVPRSEFPRIFGLESFLEEKSKLLVKSIDAFISFIASLVSAFVFFSWSGKYRLAVWMRLAIALLYASFVLTSLAVFLGLNLDLQPRL